MYSLSKIVRGVLRRINHQLLRVKVLIECMSDEEKRSLMPSIVFSLKLKFLPYKWTDEYNSKTIKVYKSDDGFPYVYRNGCKLYLKKKWSKSEAQRYYNSILLDQDIRSPHRYLLNGRVHKSSKHIADVGAAEGVFALDLIYKVEKIYLFECDEEWIEPLKKTFSAFSDKIEIIEKKVGCHLDSDNETLDNFFKDKRIDLIKADIEGAEEDMLHGGGEILKRCKEVMICTYHTPDAQYILKDILEGLEYSCKYNEGFSVFHYDLNTFHPPYVRKCLLYGYRK